MYSDVSGGLEGAMTTQGTIEYPLQSEATLLLPVDVSVIRDVVNSRKMVVVVMRRASFFDKYMFNVAMVPNPNPILTSHH